MKAAQSISRWNEGISRDFTTDSLSLFVSKYPDNITIYCPISASRNMYRLSLRDWAEMSVVTMMATVEYSVCYSNHYSLSSRDKWTGKCLDQFHKVKSMNWLQENMCFWLGQSCGEHIVREGLSGTGRQNFLLKRGKVLGLTKMPIFKG